MFSENLEAFRLEPSKGAGDFDQKVIDSIEQFIPSRSELIEVFSTIALYDTTDASAPVIHKFFESLIPYTSRPGGLSRYHNWDWDNLKFIVQECFILAVAIFLKHERYDIAEYLLTNQYYIEKDETYGRSSLVTFAVFRNYLESLNYRNERLELRRLSLHADLLKERCTESGLHFKQIMQADFLLYLAEAIQGVKEDCQQAWWPETLVFKPFHGGTFEIFLRSESTEYFKRVAPTLGIKTKAELEPFIEGLKTGSVYTPKWEYDRISPLELMNYEKLCSRA